jgi:hypothetical protein
MKRRIIEQALYVLAFTPDQATLVVRLLEQHVRDNNPNFAGLSKNEQWECYQKERFAKELLKQFDPYIACGGADYVVANGERRFGKYAKAIAIKALKLNK